jgi:hypothetical protein
MVEVQRLNVCDGEPKGDHWVLIEKRGNSYLLTGVANGRAVDPHIAPTGFGSAETAMQAAISWAEYLEVPIIYTKIGKLRVVSPSVTR